jgi:repressor LexA
MSRNNDKNSLLERKKKANPRSREAVEYSDYYDDELTGQAVYGEADETSWDFRYDKASPDGNRFTFNQRQPLNNTSEAYRLLGQKPATTSRQGQAVPKTPANKVQLNHHNSSVKMVAGDSGPAPWENWASVSYLKLPVVGEVAAGQYDVTVAYHEPGYGVDADFVLVNSEEIKVNRDTFALKVRGQSMIDNEIDDGDIIIVQAQTWADDGDFVVACLTDSTDPAGFVTLKRFYRHRHQDKVLLQPANQQLGPIYILPQRGDATHDDLDGVKIQGKVTAIIKSGWLG